MSNSTNITWTMRLKRYTWLTAVSILMLVKILSLATRSPTSQKSSRPPLYHPTLLLFNRTSLHDLSQPGLINKDEPDLEHLRNPIQRSFRPQPTRHRDLPDLTDRNRDLPDLNTATEIYPTSTTTAGVYPTSSWTKHNNNRDLPDLKQVTVSQRFIQTLLIANVQYSAVSPI